MSEFGIRKEDVVVVYDIKEFGIFSVFRVGWMFKVFGYEKVYVFNNFKFWVDEGLLIELGEFYNVECCIYFIFKVEFSQVVDYEDVEKIVFDYNKEGLEGV